MEKEILDFINKLVREEHGNTLTIEDLFIKSDMDSFGTTMVFMELNEKYGCFEDKWFRALSIDDWKVLTVKDLIERVTNEGSKL